MCLLNKEIQRQPQLRLTLLTINTKKGLLQLVENTAPSLRPMPVRGTKAVTVLLAVMSPRPMPNQTTSNNSKVKKRNRDIHEEDKMSLGLFGGSDLHDNTVCNI